MRTPRTARWVACAAAFCLAPVHAGVIAVDGDVPAIMDAGGTADDPARYVIGESGPQVRDFGGDVHVGNLNDHHELVVQSGSVISSDDLSIGYSRDHNRVNVRGEGTRWSAAWLDVGWTGSSNTLVVSEGAVVSYEESAYVGHSGSGNRLIVDGAGSSLLGSFHFYLARTSWGTNNQLIVSNGGYASSLSASIGYDGSNNAVMVAGFGSYWDVSGYLLLSVSEGASGNTLEILDRGLVTVGEAIEVGADSFLRLDGGFLAERGDLEGSDLLTLLAGGKIQFLDGEDWVVGTSNDFHLTYVATNEEGLSLTGYHGLAGYTVLSSLATIPEPSAAGLALLGAGLAMLRRRRG